MPTVEEFQELLKASEASEISRSIISRDANWYFDECGELGNSVSYEIFRTSISAYLGLKTDQVALVGSSVYGFSLSPREEKSFSEFHEKSDLDLVIISAEIFDAVWNELLDAYYRGHRWILQRHSSEIFRRFALLISEGSYKTSLLRERAKILNGISKEVYVKTGSFRTLKYRIYQSREAAIEYHTSGLMKMKRRLENDA